MRSIDSDPSFFDVMLETPPKPPNTSGFQVVLQNPSRFAQRRVPIIPNTVPDRTWRVLSIPILNSLTRYSGDPQIVQKPWIFRWFCKALRDSLNNAFQLFQIVFQIDLDELYRMHYLSICFDHGITKKNLIRFFYDNMNHWLVTTNQSVLTIIDGALYLI